MSNFLIMAMEIMFVYRSLIWIFIILVVFVQSFPPNQNSVSELISSNPDCDHHLNNRLKRNVAEFPDGSRNDDNLLGLKINPFFAPFQ